MTIDLKNVQISDVLTDLTHVLGAAYVLTGEDTRKWQADWTQTYSWMPSAVLRPQSVKEVSAIMRIASQHQCPVVPVSGNTELSGGTVGEGALVLA